MVTISCVPFKKVLWMPASSQSTVNESQLITPYGGELINLLAPIEKRTSLRQTAASLPYIQLTPRQLCDLELLAVGGFSPLDRFMSQADFESVVDTMRLSNGALFPMPIILTVHDADEYEVGTDIALRDTKNRLLALMHIEEKYTWSREHVAEKVFLTQDARHPLVAEMNTWGETILSGKLTMIELPTHYDFSDLRMTPNETRTMLTKFLDMGYDNVVAFQTRNPMHRVHEELTKRAINEKNAVLLLHPVVGMTKPGDVDHYTRVRTYKTLVENYYDVNRVCLSLLPFAMRMAGPREAVWHAIIRRNYGANHFIVGRDHAGPGKDSNGNPFYGAYDAQDLVTEYQDEIGVKMMPFKMVTYLPDENRYEEISKISEDTKQLSISGTQVRSDYLAKGRTLPEWFTRPEVADILQQAYPPNHKKGLCVWFTGLSGSGKSAIAEALVAMLGEYGKTMTVLDGDVVRTHLSKGLGFSKEDRDTNIRRIGFVASEISRHGGTAICAAISPYHATRNEVRNMMPTHSNFVEVFVDTPLEICEERDTKGLYRLARLGEIKNFTGIDDPYEAPEAPEIRLTTHDTTPQLCAKQIIDYLLEQSLL